MRKLDSKKNMRGEGKRKSEGNVGVKEEIKRDC